MNRVQILFYQGRKNRVKFVNRVNFVFGLVLLINIQIVKALTQPHEFFESRIEPVESHYCDFSGSERIYNITDLLQCMNELASAAVSHTRMGRSSEVRDYSISKRAQSYPDYTSKNYQYPQRPSSDYSSYYDGRPTRYYPGSSNYQGGQSGYYDGGVKYPYQREESFDFSGGASAGLFNALASISQYDDLKCVPRILCELATGVIPGNSGYKQSYDGGNSLIGLLTALDIGESSPLLTFGKSALTGYTSRGNPSVCYREYPKCPRSNTELVNYLNNHNGGFFRFFGNVRGPNPQGNYYRGSSKREPALPPGISGPDADRTGTGELKFDNSAGLTNREYTKRFFPDRREINDPDRITFPQELLEGQQSLNRISKSLMGYQSSANDYQNPSFFPQDRKDQESNMVHVSSPFNQAQNGQRFSRTMESSRAKLYLPDDITNETISTFTFPDGQKVRINVAFSKLFSESYRKALRRSFANDHSPQPVNFEGFSMINLAELYPNDRSRFDLQVVHPCDMICHDVKGTAVQFNQILLHSDSLSTLMAPDQPILDLSNILPCEIMCIDRRGERRQFSTSLNEVLRKDYGHQQNSDVMDFQDNRNNQDYRSLKQQQRQQRSKKSKSHKVRENIEQLQKRRTQRQLYGSKARDGGKIRNQRTFFTRQIPFMAMPEFSQGSPRFLSTGSSIPLALSIQPMQGMPMQSDGGIMQRLGMIPMFPGMIPMIDPLAAAGLVSKPPWIPSSLFSTKLCNGPTCPTGFQFPQIVLMMCNGMFYFIPQQIIGILPVCAIFLESATSTNSASTTTTIDSIHGNQVTTEGNQWTTEKRDKILTEQPFEQMTDATANNFRQPEGEDYPQQSCLEGKSWNSDTNECVPIKYNPEIEMDYIHLPGSPQSGINRKSLMTHRLKKRKKLVIITDKGNITYIKAN